MTTTPLIQGRDITHSYGGEDVLGGVSVDLAAGETLAVIGPSGSGKTTLLHCLAGILVPTGGSVLFDGSELSALPDAKRSALRLNNFGFVFQDGQLLPELSARDNVALSARLGGTPTHAVREKAQQMLDKLGIGHLGQQRPGKIGAPQAFLTRIAMLVVLRPLILATLVGFFLGRLVFSQAGVPQGETVNPAFTIGVIGGGFALVVIAVAVTEAIRAAARPRRARRVV